jgi:hypothetical protein
MKYLLIIVILLCSCSPKNYNYKTAAGNIETTKIKKPFNAFIITGFAIGAFIGISIVSVAYEK